MTYHHWPAKAQALSALAIASIAAVAIWAEDLGLAEMAAPDAAEAIAHAVADRVEYRRERGDHFQSAAATLRRGYDDCDGHAIIAAALAAAAGHNSRIIGVSLDGVSPEHVRAEVGSGGRWYPADSTGPVPIGEFVHAPIAYVHPTSPRRDTLPAPVGGYFDGLLDDPVDWLTGKVDDIFGGVARVGSYLTSGPVLSDLKRLVTDPEMLLAVATIVGCSAGSAYMTAVSGGIAGLATGPCAAAMAKAYVVIAAETDAKVGPARWKTWGDRERAEAVQRAERRIGAAELAARARTVERIVQMQPETLFARYPQVAENMMAALRSSGDGEVRTTAQQLAAFNRGPEDAVSDALSMLRHPNQRIRLAADLAFDRASAALEREIDALLDDCAPIRPDVMADLEVDYGPDARLEWCSATNDQRDAWRNRARLGREDVPPIRPDVRNYLQARVGRRWSVVWAAASTARRRDLVALTRMADGACPPIRPDVRNYLRATVGDPGWARAWCLASDEQRDAWRAIGSGRTTEVDITKIGRRERADFTHTAKRPQRQAAGSGGGAGLVFGAGLAAFLLWRA